ncbi:hypothetical protein LJR016_002259 [Devosia sp. LjRoot16]|uniref:hypothetical protein n=1 Tax=Devosia sp. LjRoot16 TaxID=3342271 RepID=UPI003ED0E584
MRSITPEHLDRRRHHLKSSRLFEDAMYAAKPFRSQRQMQDIELDVGGQRMITQQIQAHVDWTDLEAEPVEVNILTYVQSGRASKSSATSYRTTACADSPQPPLHI